MREYPATPQEMRDDLFERAKLGEITGEQADAEAIRLGLGGLSSRPGPEEFRPETDRHWTLPMAVAWIAYLDLDVVREWSASYRTHCFDWHWQRWRRGFDGPTYEGWHLEQRAMPTLSLLAISASVDPNEKDSRLRMSIGEAEKALWDALRSDCFRASGLNESGRRVEIPPLEWHDLKLILGRGDSEELCFGFDRVAYRQVLFPATALTGLWREPVENVERLPPTMRPDGDGFMPLYLAAQWIATERGALSFPPNDPPRWRAAYAELLAAISSDRVRVIGLRAGEREVLPGHIFAGIQIDYPYEDPEIELMVGQELFLRSYPYLDEEHWRGGFDDALVQKREAKWIRLMVEKGDVRRLWPEQSKKSSLSTPVLPLSMPPTGHGYMPLYCAAEWIATRGGKADFNTWEERHWPPAFDALLAAIASEKVRVTGIRDRLREPVPAAVFAALKVYYPSGNADDAFVGTGEPYMQSWPYSGEEDWRGGRNDQISSHFELEWTALMVEKGDVRLLWPFAEPDTALEQNTGLPGRPTKAKHLIDDELRRRGRDKRLSGSLVEEAAELLAWLIDTHPAVPRPTTGTIANNIRREYRRLRATK